MIKLTVEGTIDIDSRRKIWISGTAEGDPDDVNLAGLANGLCESVTKELLASHERTVGGPGRVPLDAQAAVDRAALAGESREADPMRTFED